jgi:glycosyltransferase involved in cell wall biosynthesis
MMAPSSARWRIALYDNLVSGGSRREAFGLASQLVMRGHTVDLWTTTAAAADFLPLEAVCNQVFRFTWPKEPRIPGRLPGVRRYLAAGAQTVLLARISAMARGMARAIDGGGYDFVLVHPSQIIHSPYLLRYLTTVSVYYCAEPMREFYEPAVPRPYRGRGTALNQISHAWYSPAIAGVRWLQKRADQKNAQSASLLLTNSYVTAESIFRAYGRRALVSYLGVDGSVFHPLDIERRNLVISVGAVGPLKGYDFLVESLGRMPAGLRPALMLVGNTASRAEEAYLRELARARDVDLEVRTGISDAELVRLYNQAKALVYSPVLEPFGFAPLEAMACGTPVVAVAEGGVRESVRDGVTGLLTQRDPRCFAAALARLLEDAELHARLSTAGVEEVRRFWTWDTAYERFMDLVTRHIAGDAQVPA